MGVIQIGSISNIERAMLVKRFQNGELGAFDEIVNRCRERVYNLAYRFTRNYEDAYDVSQEVFIKVFRSLSKLKESTAFDVWLRTVTVNTCMDYLRKRPSEQVLCDFSCTGCENISGAEYELPNKPMEDSELQRIISRAIDQLPKRQRKVFILRHHEGLSLKDIAKSLNCSLGTVKAHLFRATRRLRKLLVPYVSYV